VEPGVPQTSKRTSTRPAGAAAKSTGKGAAKSNGAAKSGGGGSSRQRPVDPRTEDPSSPTPRPGKTVWRRPGAAGWRAQRSSDNVIEVPIDFAVAMPTAPPTDRADPAPEKTDSRTEVHQSPLTIRSVAPLVQLPTVEIEPRPAALVPTEPAPTELIPAPELPATAPILYDQAATIDDVTQIGPVLDQRPLRRPIQFRRAPRPRVRRVTRVVRHVDTWSVFKVALVFSAFFYAVSLVAGVLLWQVAYATGTIDNVEKFFEGFGWETFKFNGGQIYHNAWIAGLFIAVGLTGLAVLLATLFNLITDLVGGIRLSVLEEEVRSREERGTIAARPEQVDETDVEVEQPAEAADAGADDLTTESLAVESG
jgi:hypothetical protein